MYRVARQDSGCPRGFVDVKIKDAFHVRLCELLKAKNLILLQQNLKKQPDVSPRSKVLIPQFSRAHYNRDLRARKVSSKVCRVWC